MQKDEIEESVKLVADLAKVADALESEALKKAKGGSVFRVDAGDHGVLAGLPGLHDERFEQKRANAVAALA